MKRNSASLYIFIGKFQNLFIKICLIKEDMNCLGIHFLFQCNTCDVGFGLVDARQLFSGSPLLNGAVYL